MQTTAPVDTTTQVPTDVALPQDEGRHRVALLVPLSGANADVGQSIANATTMALLDTNAENLRITTYDTEAGAGRAASRAIADGNQLILGPLQRDNVAAVLAQARSANVPLITFSNDISVAEPDVFVMGHVPEQSIDRTVAFAISQGARNFAALVPTGEYGQRAVASLQRAVDRGGARLVVAETFDRGNTSIVSAAARLDQRGGFDTVLIADGARLAAMAASELKDAGEVLPSIIGPELWSGETTLTRAAAMEGAWFSAVSDRRYRQFVTAYESRFGSQPYRIATLGYDAVLLTLRVARDWRPGTSFPTGQMLDPDGFIGLDGPLRFRSNGIGERAMEVRQVDNGGFSTVDPAPTQF
ncbi:penicillin-binding protein activator [Alteraurantiacibacter aestuarii]